LTRALQVVMQRGTGRSSPFARIGVAGKTGTTNDNRDSWFAGFDNSKLSVVWVGRDDNQSTGLTGSSGALRVWNSMTRRNGVDPIVLGSQIVMGLQTVVSRTLPPRRPGVITVGAFHSGTKHNIISDAAHLQLTVRSESAEDRTLLLDGIRRVAENMGRVAGLPDELLPRVVVSDESVPPTLNDRMLTERIMTLWNDHFGEGVLFSGERLGMGAEDFPLFTVNPYIPSLYFAVGGTPPEDFAREQAGGEPVPSHHSPLFKVEPTASVTLGVEASVTALLDLLNQ